MNRPSFQAELDARRSAAPPSRLIPLKRPDFYSVPGKSPKGLLFLLRWVAVAVFLIGAYFLFF